MRMAKWSFTLAGAYGLLATIPLYFQAALTPDTLWLFVFAGAAAATQLAYLLIGSDPVRYRMIIPMGIASKLSFGIPVTMLFLRGGLPVSTFVFGLIDFALAALFAINFVKLGRRTRQAT